jgi:preprotein translocase subunit SecD
MKNFIFLIITVIISITLTSGIQKAGRSTKSITLQSTNKNIDPVALNKSAEIITERLKLFGISTAEVKVSADKQQLKVFIPDNTDISDIEGLVTSKGDLAFYETFTHSEITDLLKPDNQLFKLLDQDNMKSPSDPRVGCTKADNLKKTDEYLHSFIPVKNCKLNWGSETKKSGYCLFALKTKEDGKPLLTRLDIETVKIAKTSDMQGVKIQIKLKQGAASIFAEATRNNINKSIAVVIDDRVISWPRVQDAIEGGEIEVTGDFTENEANYFPVIFNTEQLPQSFKIMR